MILHTDIPTRADIERLLTATDGPCVSIYLPTHRITAETDRDRLLLRDLVKQAVEQLQEAGTPRKEIEAIEAPLVHLAEDEDDFWVDQAQSLAVFASPNRLETRRLPNHLTEQVEVSDRFHIKPLLRAVTFPNAAWVLVVTQGSARLFELGPEGAARPVRVEGLPRDARQVSDAKDQRVRELAYARRVDGAIRPILTGSSLPLVLMAAQPLASIYASVNSYPHLHEGHVHANLDEVTEVELSEAVRPILDELYAAQMAELTDTFNERVGTGRAATDLTDLARLATLGAIETLIVDIDVTVSGFVDDAGVVTFSDTDDAANYGVVDEITRRVLLSGGHVLAVRAAEVPGGGAAAALLRYAI